MSRKFKVLQLFRTTDVAKDIDHDGNPYINVDLPKGSLIAVDEDGEWYLGQACMYAPDMAEYVDGDLRKISPKGYMMFRDHWCILGNSDEWTKLPDSQLSPYDRAIRNVPKKQVA